MKIKKIDIRKKGNETTFERKNTANTKSRAVN